MSEKGGHRLERLLQSNPKYVPISSRPPCFLQKYLLPLIMGGREDRKQLERMEASLSELSGSVAQTGKD